MNHKRIDIEKQGKNMKPIRIALTKGRLEEKSIEMFEQLGYDCSADTPKYTPGGHFSVTVFAPNFPVIFFVILSKKTRQKWSFFLIPFLDFGGG